MTLTNAQRRDFDEWWDDGHCVGDGERKRQENDSEYLWAKDAFEYGIQIGIENGVEAEANRLAEVSAETPNQTGPGSRHALQAEIESLKAEAKDWKLTVKQRDERIKQLEESLNLGVEALTKRDRLIRQQTEDIEFWRDIAARLMAKVVDMEES